MAIAMWIFLLAPAYGEKRVPTIFVYSPGENALTVPQARTLVDQLKFWMRVDHGVRIVGNLRIQPDRCRRVTISNRLDCVAAVARRDKKLVLAIRRPIKQFGVYHIGGAYSETCGLRKKRLNAGWCAAEMYNSAGVYREFHSMVNCYQVLSGLLGAKTDNQFYDNGISYMSDEALFNVDRLIVTDKTKREIARCVH